MFMNEFKANQYGSLCVLVVRNIYNILYINIIGLKTCAWTGSRREAVFFCELVAWLAKRNVLDTDAPPGAPSAL